MVTTKLQRAEQAMQTLLATADPESPFLFDPHLQLLAGTVQSTEEERIRLGHRIGQALNRLGINKGVVKGKIKLLTDMSELDPDLLQQLPSAVQALKEVQSFQKQAEAIAVKGLEALMFEHPLWIKYGQHTKGVGLKQFARMLAEIGDPYWIVRYDQIYAEGDDPKDPASVPIRIELVESRPRTLAQLNSYTGYGVTAEGRAPRRTAGQVNKYRSNARKRLYLLAKQQVKITGSAYRPLYDETKEFYTERGHIRPCPLCKGGEAANPAGSPMRPAHADRAALRRVAKQLLADVYDTAAGLHQLARDMQAAAA